MTVKFVHDQQYAPLFCTWLTEHIPGSVFTPADTITFGNVEFSDDGSEFQILFVVGYHNRTMHTCQMSAASSGEKRQKLSPNFLHGIFRYAFETDKRTAIYATVDVRNETSKAIAEKMGFRKTGYLPHFCGENLDAYLYAFTRDEWYALRSVGYSTKSLNKTNNEVKH